MDLLLPNAQSLRSLEHSAAILLLGQGFTSRTEFLTLARTATDNICTVAPFGTTAPGTVNAGRLTVLADACIGVDLGVTAALPAAPRALGIGTGVAIEQALGDLTVPSVTATTSALVRADTVWRLSYFGGSTTKLVAVIRKPPPGSPPGECYSLPVVVVDVDPARDWWRLIVRALAQATAGLVDEFTRDEPDRAAPPASALAAPRNRHLFGRNTITVDPTEAAKLGTQSIEDIFGDTIDAVWADTFSGITPYRPSPLGAVTAPNPKATIRLAQGAAGYRTGVLRCDQPCLLAQAPAEPMGPTPPPRTDPVGSHAAGEPAVGLCPVCERLVAKSLGSGWTTSDAKIRHLDRQVSHWDLANFRSRTKVTGSAAQPVNEVLTRGVTWQFSATADVNGLTISGLKLANRPGDPMADSANVAESITYVDLAYETSTGKHDLDLADAMVNTAIPPVFEIGRNATGELRVGVRLIVHWQPEDGLTIRADMSLVCRDIARDFDPGGIAEACKFYPELVLTWTRRDLKVPQVRRVHGTVRMVLNNRITGTHHAHGGMVHNSQLVMLLTDSNSAKKDAEYHIPSIGKAIAILTTGILLKALTASWQGGRVLGGLDRSVGVAAYLGWREGITPLLPEWSWLFDYGRGVGVGGDEVVEVMSWEDADPVRGAHSRKLRVDWPPVPDPALGNPLGKPPGITVMKVQRQGAFDNVHVNADMGVDDHGRKVVAAPFCADVCLHLHVRWGVEAVAAASGDNQPPFLGWSTGPEAYSHSTLGAPLVPPNQRVSFGVSRPDATKTVVRYIGEVAWPKPGKSQVILEQGLGFAYSYAGLAAHQRPPLASMYGDGVPAATLAGFLTGDDADLRDFFAAIYRRIRFLSYGFPSLLAAPQEIPVDFFADPDSVGELDFFKLVQL